MSAMYKLYGYKYLYDYMEMEEGEEGLQVLNP
jgi:hypothetical protein